MNDTLSPSSTRISALTAIRLRSTIVDSAAYTRS
jgi:hypothetical protein